MTNDLSSVERSLDRGDAEQALERAEAALDDRPDWPRAHMLAASAAARLGRFDEAQRHLDVCRKTLELHTDNLDAHLTIARLYTEVEGFDAALELLEPLLDKFGESPELLDILALNLHQAERFQDAIVLYKKLLKQEPDNLNLHHNVCTALLADGDAKQAASFANKWLKLAPADTEALSIRAIALEEAGHAVAAHNLMNFDRFVVSEIIEVPDGYGSLETFNRSLEIVILSSSDLSEPSGDDYHYDERTTKVTGQLLGLEIGPFADLKLVIRAHLRAYYSKIDRPKAHPFIAANPKNYEIVAWASVIEDEGEVGSHIHSDGHLSGCYFCRLPTDPGDENAEAASGLDLGNPSPEFGCTRNHRHMVIKPEEGMMVLFPSYMYQRSIPFQAKGRRICIEFKVVAK